MSNMSNLYKTPSPRSPTTPPSRPTVIYPSLALSAPTLYRTSSQNQDAFIPGYIELEARLLAKGAHFQSSSGSQPYPEYDGHPVHSIPNPQGPSPQPRWLLMREPRYPLDLDEPAEFVGRRRGERSFFPSEIRFDLRGRRSNGGGVPVQTFEDDIQLVGGGDLVLGACGVDGIVIEFHWAAYPNFVFPIEIPARISGGQLVTREWLARRLVHEIKKWFYQVLRERFTPRGHTLAFTNDSSAVGISTLRLRALKHREGRVYHLVLTHTPNSSRHGR